jgi:hypothetical protein
MASPSLGRHFCDRPTLDACDWDTRMTSPQSLAWVPPHRATCHLPSPPLPWLLLPRCCHRCPAVVAATPTPPCRRRHPGAATAAQMPPLCLHFCFPDAAATAPTPLPSLLLPRRRRHCPDTPALAAAAPTPPLWHHPAAPPSLPAYG